MKKATTAAMIISILLFIGVIALLYIKRSEVGSLTLNEWGDFLAGFAAPLAFVWLVAGYLQQGKELQLNTAALEAQQEELRQQVEATRELVAQSNRQAEASEEAAKFAKEEAEKNAKSRAMLRQPDFTIARWGIHDHMYTFALVNHKSEVFNVQIRHGEFVVDRVKKLGNGQKYEFVLQGPFHDLVNLTIEYIDVENHPGHMVFIGEPEAIRRTHHEYSW